MQLLMHYYSEYIKNCNKPIRNCLEKKTIEEWLNNMTRNFAKKGNPIANKYEDQSY